MIVSRKDDIWNIEKHFHISYNKFRLILKSFPHS
jgi:hypothetical protein